MGGRQHILDAQIARAAFLFPICSILVRITLVVRTLPYRAWFLIRGRGADILHLRVFQKRPPPVLSPLAVKRVQIC